MTHDKRSLKRYDIFLIVEFKQMRSPGGYSVGITKDLSPDGFSLESQTIDCVCGDILEFRIKHPDAQWAVTISGEVVWKNHSWYKYDLGIKFLTLSEDQDTKILKLMSAVKEPANIPAPTDNDSEIIDETGLEKETAAEFCSGGTDETITGVFKDHSINEAGPCDISGTEKNITASGYEATCAYRVDEEEVNRKKKIWIYAPLVTIILIIFVIALPVMIKNFNTAPSPALTEAEAKSHKIEETLPPEGVEKIIQNRPELNMEKVRESESYENTKALLNNVETKHKIDLVTEIDETLKALKSMQDERPPVTEAITGNESLPDVGPEVKAVEEEKEVPRETGSVIKSQDY